MGSTTRRFLCDGWQAIAEHNTSGGLLRRHIPGPGLDLPVATLEGSGSVDRRWLYADERGSVVALAGGTGSLLARNTYDEYGVPGPANAGRFQYTGQAWLPEARLYHYRARAYAPNLGRFMQTDPIGYAAGANLYAYVGGDPVNRIDPTGLDYLVCSGGRWVSVPVESGDQVNSWNWVRNCTTVSELPGSNGGPCGGGHGGGGRTIGSYFERQGYDVIGDIGYDDRPDTWQCTMASYGRLYNFAGNVPGVIAMGIAARAAQLANMGAPNRGLALSRSAGAKIFGAASIFSGVVSFAAGTISGDTELANSAALGIAAPTSVTNEYMGPAAVMAGSNAASGVMPTVPPACMR